MAKIILNDRNIADYMKRNKCSREEAIELIKYDNEVEDGNPTEFDLTPEQVKVVQDMNRKIDHKKPSNTRRERKPNEVKEAIVAELAEFLREDAQRQDYAGVVITNKSRMIHFSAGGHEYDLQLIEKRAPK